MHKCLFILDTNILMHDPTAIFRFPGHDVYLAMVILEELDAAKKGMSEVARNVRQVSRFLDELIHNQTQIEHGIDLSTLPAQMATDNIEGLTLSIQTNGRLFFQTQAFPKNFLPDTLPGLNPDNSLLNTAIAIQRSDSTRQVILVSKDINLRIKAHVLGIHAEDYINDKVLDDVDLLYTGVKNLDTEFCTLHWEALRTWQGQGYYTITADFVPHLFVNQCLIGDNGFEAIVKTCAGQQAGLELARDFRSAKNNIWGINARNSEQNFALNVLMDPEIDFISLLGPAGTGKTLLALAAGLAQTLDQQRYREIIVTRVTVALGEDIGFLPGTEEEKMTPWMGALMDNLEVLNPIQGGGEWGRAATADLLHNRIRIRSLNFMRGRTFLNRYIILDEAQNLTSKQMKTLITRAGPGTKIVCLGNVAQIDTPYLTETTSGLTYVVDRFKTWQHSAHITLHRGERSRLADFASQTL